MAQKLRALVPGGVGVIGRALVRHLENRSDWEVIALSRRSPDFETKSRFVSVDLLDRDDCKRKLSEIGDVTHVFYAAYIEMPTLAELVPPNLTMLRNVVEVVDETSPGLQHVNFIQGGKAYGCHLGPFKTPGRESDPRHLPPNFYYDQEDYIRERQKGRRWTWSALRPEAVCGFAVGNPMNLVMVIAVYAAICKELGLPLKFPGPPGGYRALYQVTEARILAKAAEWAATTPECGNEIFNVTNGDYFRWENIWPSFARFFDMEVGSIQAVHLTQMMADKGPVWDRIVAKYGLRPYAYKDIAAWGFGDFIFGCEYDNITSTIKARKFGFQECIDTEEMFLSILTDLRRDRIIP
jgi:nucleoside-diphosphate-sugar epimerase